jgi:hypothetical protein
MWQVVMAWMMVCLVSFERSVAGGGGLDDGLTPT